MTVVSLSLCVPRWWSVALLAGLPWSALALDTTLPASTVPSGGLDADTALAASVPRAKAEPVTLEASRDYLIGVSASTSLKGSPQLKLRPMLAFQLGRVRVSTGGASGLLGLGRRPVDSGVSAALVQNDRWSVSTALRLQRGRSSGDDPLLQGLPGVPNTVIGRLTVL